MPVPLLANKFTAEATWTPVSGLSADENHQVIIDPTALSQGGVRVDVDSIERYTVSAGDPVSARIVEVGSQLDLVAIGGGASAFSVSCSPTSGKIRKHSGFSATIDNSFSAPGTNPTGIAWDGDDLLSTDSISQKVYKHEGISATLKSSFSTGQSVADIAWDGSNAIVGYGSTAVRRYVGFSNTIESTITSHEPSVSAVAWDGVNLLVTGNSRDSYKYDGFSATLISSFSNPANARGQGLGWNGTDLLLAPTIVDSALAYRLDGFSNTILETFTTPEQLNGIEWIPDAFAGSCFATVI